MEIRINEIYSRKMFPGLIMGKAKLTDFAKSLEEMKERIEIKEFPTINTVELRWTDLLDNDGKRLGYGTYGHIAGAQIEIVEGEEYYNFCIIFNYIQEIENLNEKINKIISEVNWKQLAFNWNIGDL
jgi:hypothetical protein